MKNQFYRIVCIYLVQGLVVVSAVAAPPKAFRAEKRMIPPTFFATTTHVNTPANILMLKDLKVPCVRIAFCHNVMEPSEGNYAFGANNPPHSWIIDSADLGIKEGLDQLAVVTNGAPWMVNSDYTWPSDQYLKTFEDFMFAIATKYKGKIRYWEAMNEPDLTGIWKTRYVPLLQAFYRGVKRADPNNKVVLAGFAGQEESQLEMAYRQGVKDYFDILNSHPYTRPLSPEEGGYIEKLHALYKVMRKYGDYKPLWVTEVGWNGVEPSMLEYLKSQYEGHRSYSCTLEEQARYLPRVYLLSLMYPWIDRVHFFQLHNSATRTTISANQDDYIGLVESWAGGTMPRDSYFSVKTVIQMLSGSTFISRIPMGKRIWALMFEQKDDAFIALWSLDDNVTLKLKNASMIRKITSMVGTPILLQNNTLHLSGRPIYVHVAKDQLRALAAQIQRGELAGAPEISLAIGLNMKTSSPDRAMIDTIIQNVSNKPQPMSHMQITIAPPYSLTHEENDLGVLAPGEEKTVSVPVNIKTAAGGIRKMAVSAVLGDHVVDAKAVIDYFVIPSWKGPDAEKAVWDDWPVRGELELQSGPKSIRGSNWRSADDCSATVRLAWSPDSFYFAAKVRDEVLKQDQSPIAIWMGDSIQIGLDTAGDAKPSANVQQYDGVNDVEFGLAWSKPESIAYAWTLPENRSGMLKPTRLTVTRDEIKKITTYLAVLPWAALGVTSPKEGQWMGMNVLINDDDGKKKRSWIEWTGGIGAAKDPSQFAKVLFE